MHFHNQDKLSCIGSPISFQQKFEEHQCDGNLLHPEKSRILKCQRSPREQSSSSLTACLQEGVWCVFLRPAKTAQAAIQELRVTTSQRSHFALTHPYRSAAAAAYITRNKPTHPPTHSPTYPNRSLSRNPKPRPRCVRSKKPNVVTRVFGQMGENPRIKQTQNELGKKEKTQTNKQTDIHQIHNIVPFLPIPPPPPPPPPSLHRLQNCYFCALLRVKERRRRRREETEREGRRTERRCR
jgi:hypothetical protein